METESLRAPGEKGGNKLRTREIQRRNKGICQSLCGSYTNLIFFLGGLFILFDRISLGLREADLQSHLLLIKNNEALLGQSNNNSKLRGHGSHESVLAQSLRKIQTDLVAQSERISNLTTSLTDIKNEFLEDCVNCTGSDLPASSEVSLIVHENFEKAGSKQWVFPCSQHLQTSCETDTQEKTFVSLAELVFQSQKSDENRRKLRIAQLGTCSTSLLNTTLQNLSGNISKYILIDSSFGTSSKRLCNNFMSTKVKSFKKQIDLLKKEYHETEIVVTSRNPMDERVASGYSDKYFDLIFVDSSPNMPLRKEDLEMWLKLLRYEGVLFGHHYGVQPQRSESAKTNLSLSWFQNNQTISREALVVNKEAVDDFVHSMKSTVRVRLEVAGDTVWYVLKSKMSIMDIFKGSDES